MNIFTNLFRAKALTTSEKKSFGLTDAGLWTDIFSAGTATISGQSIGPDAAMRVSSVRAAVTLISEMVGSLPVKLFDAETKAVAKAHPAYRLIHDDASEFMSAEEFRAILTRDALLHGSGFAFVNRVNGKPVELNRLDPNAVTVKVDQSTGAPVYVVALANGGTVTYFHDQILRIRCPGGVSPIVHGREAIALALVMEQHAAKLFGAGARPSGVLSTEKPLGDEAKGKIALSWNSKFGPGGPGGTAILDEKMQWEALTLNSVDAQFLESRRFQIEEIARLFNIPVTMLNDLTNGTLANVEQQNLQFRTNCLAPWFNSWSRALGRALLTVEERDHFYVEFLPDGLLTADTAARAAAYAQYRSMGVMTANEVRSAQNLPALPGGDVLQNPYTTTAHAPASTKDAPA